MKNLSINKKLFYTLGLLILSLIFISAYFLYNLSLLQNIDSEQRKIIEATNSALELDIDAVSVIASVKDYINTQNSDLISQIKQLHSSEDKNREKLRQLTSFSEVLSLLNEYESLLPTRRLLTDRVIQIISTTGTGEDVRIISAEKDKIDVKIREYLKQIVTLENKHLDETIQSGSELRSRVQIGTTIFTIGASIFLALLFFYIIRSITSPIKTLTELANKIGKGDLDVHFPPDSKNEIGTLSSAFKNMIETLENSQENVKSQNKKLEESLDKVQIEKDKVERIMASIGDGVFVVDKDFKIILFNPVCESLSGFSKSEAIGQKYDKVLNFIDEDNNKPQNQFILDCIEKGIVSSMRSHTTLINKFGQRIAVADSASPIRDKESKVIGCVVVFRNVTKEREIDKAKTEFVSLASHQLRTPLSAINWYSEMLLTEDAGKINDQQREFLQMVHDGNKRMVELVNSLLNVSRIELSTFAIEPEPLFITDIAESVIGELKPQINEKKLELKQEFEKVPKVNLDQKLTRMILQNLFSNAVKYTKENGNVEVKIWTDKDNIKVAVKDNGLGIPKAQQSRIFSKLFRADNVILSDVEGTGLGLYIVKAIVDEAGGKIWFESEENQGTTFFVDLPLSGMKKKEGDKELK